MVAIVIVVTNVSCLKLEMEIVMRHATMKTADRMEEIASVLQDVTSSR